MTFKSQIFTPDNKWLNKYSFSEKLFGLAILGIIINGVIVLATDGKIANNSLNIAFRIFFFLTTAAPLFLMIFVRLIEYETLNGKIGEEIIISDNLIKIENFSYPISDIKEIEVQILTFYGMRTNNRRLGPTYHQGVNNKISIRVNDKIIQTFFLIKTKEQLNSLQKIIFKIILDEKIKFKYKYIDFIPEDLKATNEYKSFIEKLKAEKRLLVK